MLAFTSLNPSPVRADVQHAALLSWVAAGLEPVVLQHESEVDVARGLYFYVEPLAFGLAEGRNRRLVPLADLLDRAAREQAPVAIINSDCELGLTADDLAASEAVAQEGGMTLLRRWNYKCDYADATPAMGGIDGYVFRPTVELADCFRGSRLCLGAPWWDIALPVVWYREVFGQLCAGPERALYHRHHYHWWSDQDWYQTAEDCRQRGLVDLPEGRRAQVVRFRLIQAELWAAAIPLPRKPPEPGPSGRSS